MVIRREYDRIADFESIHDLILTLQQLVHAQSREVSGEQLTAPVAQSLVPETCLEF